MLLCPGLVNLSSVVRPPPTPHPIAPHTSGNALIFALSRRGESTGTTAVTGTLVATLLVAANLRPSIAAVGPVLGPIATDLGLSPVAQGALTTVPLVAFAAVSPVVATIVGRLGIERALVVAMFGLTVGIIARSTPFFGALWIGTVVVGASIAVGNVLLPALLKRDIAHRQTALTGAYAAIMGLIAALASGISAPIAQAVGTHGWRFALVVWAVPACIAAMLCWTRTSRRAPDRSGEPGPRPSTGIWRSWLAWSITCYLGLECATFFILLTWLPAIEMSYGVSPTAAGWHLFMLQVVGVASGLVVPRLMRGANQRLVAMTAGLILSIAAFGFAATDAFWWLWVLLFGVGAGASLVISLSLIGLRGGCATATAQLSGMAQSVGFLVAACGPVLVGILWTQLQSWQAVLIVLGVLGVAQLILGWFAGAARTVAVRPTCST